MITAVDTNVLLDVVNPDEPFADSSREALGQAYRVGSVVICEPVYSELAARFISQTDLDRFLDDTQVSVEPFTRKALHAAGQAWNEYLRRRRTGLHCTNCGNFQQVTCERCSSRIRVRQHVMSDFMIGAHAAMQTDRLLTRDRGYYASYFPLLQLG